MYRVNCKDCEKICIWETKFKMGKRMNQHKKDVEFKRMNNNDAIAKQKTVFLPDRRD